MSGKRKILIVEDVEMMLGLLSQLVGSMEDFLVSGTARNVTEARVQVSRRRPDLVLLDEILPGESSLDFLTELSALQIPAILMTSMENPEHQVASEALGRILKPRWDRMEEDRARIFTEIDGFLRSSG